jgi:hypothetical protein
MNGLMYPKKSSGDASQNADEYGEISMKSATNVIQGGGQSSVSGPTTSPRTYPKGTTLNKSADRLNPQKQPCSDIYVGGVGNNG